MEFSARYLLGVTAVAGSLLFISPAHSIEATIKANIEKESADFLTTESIRVADIGNKLLSALPERGDGLREAALPFTLSSNEEGPVTIGGLIPFFRSSLDIQKGDRLVEYQGMSVNSLADLRQFIHQTKDVSQVTIRLNRLGKEWDEKIPVSYFSFAPRFSVTGKNSEAYSEWMNGEIVVSAALLRMTEGESELAYVLAHEIAHGARNHHRTLLYDTAGNATGYAVASLITKALAPGTPVMYQHTYLAGPYLETDEVDADYVALTYLAAAGYDPSAAYNFLIKEEIEIKAGSKDSIRGIHPLSVDRLALVKKKLAEKPKEISGVSSPTAVITPPTMVKDLENLGIDLSGGADPEAAKVSNIGLAESRMYRFGVDSELKDDALVFLSTTKRIVWHAENMDKNPFNMELCQIEWYRPDGSLYQKGKVWEDVGYMLANGISLKEEESSKNIGRWKVRVTLGEKIVDERYFMVKDFRANIKIRRSEILKMEGLNEKK